MCFQPSGCLGGRGLILLASGLPRKLHAYLWSGLQMLPELADRLVSNFSPPLIDGDAPGLSFLSRCSMDCAFYCWQAAISGL